MIEHDGVILVAQPSTLPQAKTAEMAAVTVSPQSQGTGDGRSYSTHQQRARAMGPAQYFVLTTGTMHGSSTWFQPTRPAARCTQAQAATGSPQPGASQKALISAPRAACAATPGALTAQATTPDDGLEGRGKAALDPVVELILRDMQAGPCTPGRVAVHSRVGARFFVAASNIRQQPQRYQMLNGWAS